MFFYTALLFGLLSSLHCGGMCGPIALSLPRNGNSPLQNFSGKFLYNSGRIATYTLLGGFLGMFGKGLSLAGIQQGISIALGIGVLLVVAFSYNPDMLLQKISAFRIFQTFIIKRFQKVLKRPSFASMFIVGVLNGLLPCGVVYIALTGALATGNILSGMGYMALFGLGTLPMMLAISLAGSVISLSFKKSIQKITPFVMVFFAVLLILRGLNLDIPYISPKLNNDVTMTKKCH
jgi:sulfite exporter TauE/SafE